MKTARETTADVSHLLCTGCGACEAVCNVHAICLQYDNEGFLFPEVDESACVHCGRCVRTCPVFHPPKAYNSDAFFSVQLKDTTALHESASGGAFYGLAKTVLSHGGVVYGCTMDKNQMPVHIRVETPEELKRLQGSKYVQSVIPPDIFAAVRRDISNANGGGRTVLFSGTPCQIAGLRNALGNLTESEAKRLYSCDVICHGVASRGVWANYLKNREIKLGETVTQVKFRCKDYIYPNNHTIYLLTSRGGQRRHALRDPFGSSFYHNRILRESCYRCAYASKSRLSDLTLGDFGADFSNNFPTRDGCSIVSVNTEKGSALLESAAGQFIMEKVGREYTQINLEQPTLRPRSRDDMRAMRFNPEAPDADIGYRVRVTIADRVKYWIPQPWKDALKRMIGKLKGHR